MAIEIITGPATSLWERGFDEALSILQARVEHNGPASANLVPFFDGERLSALSHDPHGWACQWFVKGERQYMRFQTVEALKQWWANQQKLQEQKRSRPAGYNRSGQPARPPTDKGDVSQRNQRSKRPRKE